MAASTAKARSLNELDCAAAADAAAGSAFAPRAAALTSARAIGARPVLSRLDYKRAQLAAAHDVPPPCELTLPARLCDTRRSAACQTDSIEARQQDGPGDAGSNGAIVMQWPDPMVRARATC